MADPVAWQDLGIGKIIAGIAGSAVSLRFVQGTITEKLLMTLGGSSLSYFGTTPASIWIGLANTEGLVGFLIGLFGMAIVSKIYEVIQVVDAKQIVNEGLDWIFRRHK